MASNSGTETSLLYSGFQKYRAQKKKESLTSIVRLHTSLNTMNTIERDEQDDICSLCIVAKKPVNRRNVNPATCFYTVTGFHGCTKLLHPVNWHPPTIYTSKFLTVYRYTRRKFLCVSAGGCVSSIPRHSVCKSKSIT